MPDESAAQDPQARFLHRVERRLRVLDTLEKAGLGVYLPADAQQRRTHIDMLARLIARHDELPKLSRQTLAQAADMLEEKLERLQQRLPSDVQYRNRIRSRW